MNLSMNFTNDEFLSSAVIDSPLTLVTTENPYITENATAMLDLIQSRPSVSDSTASTLVTVTPEVIRPLSTEKRTE